MDLTHCLLQKTTDNHRQGQQKSDRASRSQAWRMEIEASLGCCCGKWLEYKLLHCRIASFTNQGPTKGPFVQLRLFALSFLVSCHTVLLTRMASPQLRGYNCLGGKRWLGGFVRGWRCVSGWFCCLRAPGSCFQGSIILSIAFNSQTDS